jgi:hypothetical protein
MLTLTCGTKVFLVTARRAQNWPSDHPEVAIVVEDVPRPILLL